jgi:hypothetical protein
MKEAVQKSDPIVSEQPAKFGVPRILAGLRLREFRRIRAAAAQTKQLFEILERRCRPGARIAVVMPQEQLQRHLDARLPIAKVE